MMPNPKRGCDLGGADHELASHQEGATALRLEIICSSCSQRSRGGNVGLEDATASRLTSSQSRCPSSSPPKHSIAKKLCGASICSPVRISDRWLTNTAFQFGRAAVKTKAGPDL